MFLSPLRNTISRYGGEKVFYPEIMENYDSLYIKNQLQARIGFACFLNYSGAIKIIGTNFKKFFYNIFLFLNH
jgi:hypothetical protein